MEEVPEFGAVFTFGKSRFGDDNANKFWVKNDPVIGVACGDEHTAVVTTSGRAYTFGSNQWGQLALGHTRQTNKPSFVKSLKGKPVTHVACGRTHTLLATKSEVYACGGNGEHQVNASPADEVLRPWHVPTLSGILVKRLSCGVEHSLVLGHCGDVYLWGGGSEGQLGMGANVAELLKPTVLQFTDEKIKDASCGYYHTGLVTQSGKVFTFGENDNGKLGLGEDSDDTYHIPQPVFLVDTAARVRCGNTCTAVMTSSGGLYMCGDGQRGQLGFSPNTLNKCVYTLHKVPCPPIVDMSVGEGHTGVVSRSGHLYTFGDGRHGKLCHGDDNFATLHSPYLVESFSTIATVHSVACGGCHTMVIAKPGRPFQEEIKVSAARSKRHVKGGRLNDTREPPSIPPIRQTDTNRENNVNNIQIVEENVKTLESALYERPKKIVNLDKDHKKHDANKRKTGEALYNKTVSEKKKETKKIEEKKRDYKKKIVEEDSGSETDEPGATSDVTDSEAEEDEEEEDEGTDGGGGGFMDNIMSVDDLEPAAGGPFHNEPAKTNNRNVIEVKSSSVSARHSQPQSVSARRSQPESVSARHSQPENVSARRSQPESVSARHSQPESVSARHSQPESVSAQHSQPEKKIDKPITGTDRYKRLENANKTAPATKPPLQPTLEESSEYETETDEEGEYEDETEEEEEKEVEKKEVPVKTLVSEMRTTDNEITKDKTTPSGPKIAAEPAKPTPQKQPSKFMFWKRKPKKEEKQDPPVTPGNQTNSKACVIL